MLLHIVLGSNKTITKCDIARPHHHSPESRCHCGISPSRTTPSRRAGENSWQPAAATRLYSLCRRQSLVQLGTSLCQLGSCHGNDYHTCNRNITILSCSRSGLTHTEVSAARLPSFCSQRSNAIMWLLRAVVCCQICCM